MSLFFIAANTSHAQQGAKKPAYIPEAPLPKGWPKPGPYNQVTEKKYPVYRAAITEGKGSSFAFWRLFRHIKSQNIPMTAPVEMGMKNEEGKELAMESMAFLYQGQDVGKAGPDGSKIEVKDLPAIKVLSYAWQGKDTSEHKEKARVALFTELQKRKLQYTSIRMLGYNGPNVPKDKKTWELQAILK